MKLIIHPTLKMGASPSFLKVYTYNVLAPVFVRPEYYPGVSPSLFDAASRLMMVRNTITTLALEPDTDVICLQEVQEDWIVPLVAAAGVEYMAQWVPHDASHWSSYYTAEYPYVPNGNLTLIRSSSTASGVSWDTIVTSTGARFPKASFRIANSGRAVSIYNVHFDSDVGGNRKKELEVVVMDAVPEGIAVNAIPVIVGDWNCDLDVSNIQNVLRKSKLRDLIAELGPKTETHPFTSKYNDNPLFRCIDNFAGSARVTASSSVVFNIDAPTEAARVSANFSAVGSDHYICRAILKIQ